MLGRNRRRPLGEQVVVITGASSGIGLATARLAARRGARVVLSSFDPRQLEDAKEQLLRDGGEAIAVVADVADRLALEEVARRAVERYGRIDTWVSNAGVHIFGRLDETPLEDARRLFDVNYWGAVHGCRIAVPHLVAAGGGSLIVVGSVLASRSVPLQGMYTASKHALKAWVEALRTELRDARAPVSVSFVKPSAINTQIDHHSRSLLRRRAQLPPPLYHPRVVARCILECAERPRRDMVIGAVGLVGELGEKFVPNVVDLVMRRTFFWLQHGEEPPYGEDALHAPLGTPARELGEVPRFTLKRSAWTWAARHRLASVALLSAGAVAARALRR